ncbi:hypothetical protein G4B88_012834 [Cannabis sativa]|uniref:Phytocyanin domain-containing protein n=1 Tax=Cannabis sativa TaxID=3483 RepID=A0A7J6E7Y5_CANSA|nr:hypothetical protein G4B88_012834 [Cannabis sativa]
MTLKLEKITLVCVQRLGVVDGMLANIVPQPNATRLEIVSVGKYLLTLRFTQIGLTPTLFILAMKFWNGTWTHNVAMVSTQAEYEMCTKPGLVFLSGISHTLTKNGSYFFLCTVDDHCERGMKMIVTVGSPTDVSPTNDSTSILCSPLFGTLVTTFLSTIVIFFYNYKA